MVRIENQCTGCSDLGIPCLGRSCPNQRVPVFYCDNRKCIASNTGTDRLFKVDGSQLCMDCVSMIAERMCLDPWEIIESEI